MCSFVANNNLPLRRALCSTAEKWSDEKIVNAALDRLRICYGDKLVPNPIAYHITRWASDPFARQSYTYFAVGSSEHDTAAFAVPVGAHKQLGFAGEHTTANDMGTIHGAWATGVREAKRIARQHWDEGVHRLDRALAAWMATHASHTKL